MATNRAPDIPAAGRKAPAFTLESSTGRNIRLSALKGSPVVVYFYPKDNTPGCTTEAKEFRDLLPDFEKAGVTVLGISPDDVESHCRFADKEGLTFPLLADTGHAIAGKYGVWVEKNMYGKKFMGVQRATFLIDAEGTIARVWPKVRPRGHAAEVLEAARAL